MSLAFTSPEIRQGAPDHRSTVQTLLNENSSLIKSIRDYLSMGRTEEASKYQQLLHRNLLLLAQAADQSLLPQLREDYTSNNENALPPPTDTAPPSDAMPNSISPANITPSVSIPQVTCPPQPNHPQISGIHMGQPQSNYGYPPQGVPPGYSQGFDQQIMYQQQPGQPQHFMR
uniref:SSXT domain-containing protein n=1 Tax=Heterorhabditis bacteriophora TaxID=37862 RepID=A0A1I7XHM9_HETBA